MCVCVYVKRGLLFPCNLYSRKTGYKFSLK